MASVLQVSGLMQCAPDISMVPPVDVTDCVSEVISTPVSVPPPRGGHSGRHQVGVRVGHRTADGVCGNQVVAGVFVIPEQVPDQFDQRHRPLAVPAMLKGRPCLRFVIESSRGPFAVRPPPV